MFLYLIVGFWDTRELKVGLLAVNSFFGNISVMIFFVTIHIAIQGCN